MRAILFSGLMIILLMWTGCTVSPRYHRSRGEARPARPARPATEQAESRPSHSDMPVDYHVGQVLRGTASYYGPNFHGRLTANGETFDRNAMTCAHLHLPFGTRLEITYLKTGRTVILRVNDRGPYSNNRILDLSEGAARRLGMHEDGIGEVTARILSLGEE